MPKSNCRNVFFSPEYDSGWQKEHGRLERRRLQRVATTPEHSGLCGCWQLIAVMRERKELRKGKEVKQSQEYSFYVSSLTCEERSPKQMAQHIRGHWNACENGSHYRRDVTLGEDGSQISGRQRAQVMATLRNLVWRDISHWTVIEKINANRDCTLGLLMVSPAQRVGAYV